MGYLNKREQIFKMDRVGRMDRRITILKPIIETGDSNEDKITGWEKVADVWARKEDLRGKEMVVADQMRFMYLTAWSIRKPESGVKANWRIAYKAQVYEVVQISEGEGRERYIDVITNILDNETWP